MACQCIHLQAQSIKEKHVEELEEIKKNGNVYGLNLIGYSFKKDLNNKDDLSELKRQILSETESYFPIAIEKGQKEFVFQTLQEIKKNIGKKEMQEIVNRMQSWLDSVVDINMKVIELNWICHGQLYKTSCIVSDKGIIYDNVISNVFLFNKKESNNYIDTVQKTK